MSNKKQVVKYFLEHDLLLSEEIIASLPEEVDFETLTVLLGDGNHSKNLLILDPEIQKILSTRHSADINWKEFEKAKVLLEKKNEPQFYSQFIHVLQEEQKGEQKEKQGIPEDFLTLRKVRIIQSYQEAPYKSDIQNFVHYFNARYHFLEKLLSNRQELRNLISISRLKTKKDKEPCSVIGMVSNKNITKNNNILFTIEDATGSINILVSKSKPDLYEAALDTTLDEVVGISGVNSDTLFFANSLVLPDIPSSQGMTKCSEEAYAICLSDFHCGSAQFLPEELQRFLKWIRGEAGSPAQRAIAEKTKYIFVIGDLVDGVSIYPGQEHDLTLKDIKSQYDLCASYLQQIPEDKTIIACPGNHDAVRLSEPQTKIYEDFGEALYKLKNLIMVSNPALVNIHADDQFSGFNVLMYHGYSFDYYIAHTDSIRNQGGYDRADLIMKYLLKRRHLAPTHKSTLYIPDPHDDPLLIKIVPDFFLSGHLHKTSVSHYKNVTTVCGSCWQGKTAFQEKMGHHPEPARVPIINLQTRHVRILKF